MLVKDVVDMRFDAFGSGSFKMLGAIGERPISATEIAMATGPRQAHVTHSLKTLYGLVLSKLRPWGA